MGGVEWREERKGKKAIVWECHTTIGLFNGCVCIVNNLFMNNTVLKQPEVGWSYGQGSGVRYMGFGSFPRQPDGSCGTSGKTGKSYCTAMSFK